jgi:hypothetical protein
MLARAGGVVRPRAALPGGAARPRHLRRLSNPSAAALDVAALREEVAAAHEGGMREQVARFSTLVDRRGEFFYDLDHAATEARGGDRAPSKLLSDDLLYL